MALDSITTLQGGTCVIIQMEHHVFITDESADVSCFLNHTRTQGSDLSDPDPSLRDLIITG